MFEKDFTQFKLAALSHNEFTDGQVEILFLALNINSQKDIHDAVDILKRNRPKLVKKLNEMIKKNQ